MENNMITRLATAAYYYLSLVYYYYYYDKAYLRYAVGRG